MLFSFFASDNKTVYERPIMGKYIPTTMIKDTYPFVTIRDNGGSKNLVFVTFDHETNDGPVSLKMMKRFTIENPDKSGMDASIFAGYYRKGSRDYVEIM